MPSTRATPVQSPREDERLGDACEWERQALCDRGTCRENALGSRSLRPVRTALLDTGRQAAGTGARGPGHHSESLHSSAVTQPFAPGTTRGQCAQLCACAAPSALILRGGGEGRRSWLWRWGRQPGPRLCRVAAMCSPCFRGTGHRQREPAALRGSLQLSGFLPEVSTVTRGGCGDRARTARVCAACVCVQCACARVLCLETCTQALDSCHCIPVCSVTAGRDPSLVPESCWPAVPRPRGTAVSTVRAAPRPLSWPLFHRATCL